jgi:hypothetical protein
MNVFSLLKAEIINLEYSNFVIHIKWNINEHRKKIKLPFKYTHLLRKIIGSIYFYIKIGRPCKGRLPVPGKKYIMKL